MLLREFLSREDIPRGIPELLKKFRLLEGFNEKIIDESQKEFFPNACGNLGTNFWRNPGMSSWRNPATKFLEGSWKTFQKKSWKNDEVLALVKNSRIRKKIKKILEKFQKQILEPHMESQKRN